MEYKVIHLSAVTLTGTNFEKASEKLATLVNEAIKEGWKPQGGVTVGLTLLKEPFLLQAMTR
jgi:hypothetical protein